MLDNWTYTISENSPTTVVVSANDGSGMGRLYVPSEVGREMLRLAQEHEMQNAEEESRQAWRKRAKKWEAMLVAVAQKLERWAAESKVGGWSTHQVKPQQDLAAEIFIELGRARFQ
jgi:hypothetical protein